MHTSRVEAPPSSDWQLKVKHQWRWRTNNSHQKPRIKRKNREIFVPSKKPDLKSHRVAVQYFFKQIRYLYLSFAFAFPHKAVTGRGNFLKSGPCAPEPGTGCKPKCGEMLTTVGCQWPIRRENENWHRPSVDANTHSAPVFAWIQDSVSAARGLRSARASVRQRIRHTASS